MRFLWGFHDGSRFFYDTTTGFPWNFFGFSMGFHRDVYEMFIGLLDFHEVSIGFLQDFYRISTRFLCYFYGVAMGFAGFL